MKQDITLIKQAEKLREMNLLNIILLNALHASNAVIKTVLLQHPSVAIQRFNAVCFANSFGNINVEAHLVLNFFPPSQFLMPLGMKY